MFVSTYPTFGDIIYPFSLVHLSCVTIVVFSRAVLFVTSENPLKPISVCQQHQSASGPLVVSPLTLIYITVCVLACARPVSLIVFKMSFISTWYINRIKVCRNSVRSNYTQTWRHRDKMRASRAFTCCHCRRKACPFHASCFEKSLPGIVCEIFLFVAATMCLHPHACYFSSNPHIFRRSKTQTHRIRAFYCDSTRPCTGCLRNQDNMVTCVEISLSTDNARCVFVCVLT